MLKINDEKLLTFLEAILGKDRSLIKEEDLNKIEILNLDSKGVKDFDFTNLKMFNNVKTLNIFNTLLDEKKILDIKTSNIKNINFYKCAFVNEDDISNINHINRLLFDKCYIEKYDFMNNCFYDLNELYIIKSCDTTEIDISLINSCINLEKIYIESCKVKNVDMLKNFKNCIELSLLDSKLIPDNLSFLNEMSQLKVLYISDVYEQNKNIVNISKNVEINYDIFKNDKE